MSKVKSKECGPAAGSRRVNHESIQIYAMKQKSKNEGLGKRRKKEEKWGEGGRNDKADSLGIEW